MKKLEKLKMLKNRLINQNYNQLIGANFGNNSQHQYFVIKVCGVFCSLIEVRSAINDGYFQSRKKICVIWIS